MQLSQEQECLTLTHVMQNIGAKEIWREKFFEYLIRGRLSVGGDTRYELILQKKKKPMYWSELVRSRGNGQSLSG